MKNNLLILFMIAMCGCYNAPCPDIMDPATRNFRNYIISLDGKYKFRKLYIDNIDSTAWLDSLRMTGRVFRTQDYDIPYDKSTSNECREVYEFWGKSKSNSEIVRVNQDVHVSSFFTIATLVKIPGKLLVHAGGTRYKILPSGNSGPPYTVYNRDFMTNVRYDVLEKNDTLSFTSNHQGREIKLLFY